MLQNQHTQLHNLIIAATIFLRRESQPSISLRLVTFHREVNFREEGEA